VFYVEKATKYFPQNNTSEEKPPLFHSIIYKDAHVVDPYEEHRSGLYPFFSLYLKNISLLID